MIWDDFGGDYDHVALPHADCLLGPRVPLVVISPRARHRVAVRVSNRRIEPPNRVEDRQLLNGGPTQSRLRWRLRRAMRGGARDGGRTRTRDGGAARGGHRRIGRNRRPFAASHARRERPSEGASEGSWPARIGLVRKDGRRRVGALRGRGCADVSELHANRCEPGPSRRPVAGDTREASPLQQIAAPRSHRRAGVYDGANGSGNQKRGAASSRRRAGRGHDSPDVGRHDPGCDHDAAFPSPFRRRSPHRFTRIPGCSTSTSLVITLSLCRLGRRPRPDTRARDPRLHPRMGRRRRIRPTLAVRPPPRQRTDHSPNPTNRLATDPSRGCLLLPHPPVAAIIIVGLVLVYRAVDWYRGADHGLGRPHRAACLTASAGQPDALRHAPRRDRPVGQPGRLAHHRRGQRLEGGLGRAPSPSEATGFVRL